MSKFQTEITDTVWSFLEEITKVFAGSVETRYAQRFTNQNRTTWNWFVFKGAEDTCLEIWVQSL